MLKGGACGVDTPNHSSDNQDEQIKAPLIRDADTGPPPMARKSESRAERAASELLANRGWSISHPPRGHLLWKNEYRDYPEFREALLGASKGVRGGDGYPDFLVVDPATMRPLIVGETKATSDGISKAIKEATGYGNAFSKAGRDVLAVGVAGDGDDEIAVRVRKRSNGRWREIEFRGEPIQWLPTPHEADVLLGSSLFQLDPQVPSPEVLAERGDEINRILRECDIKDEFRPAVIAAFMLALWESKGDISSNSERVLMQVNASCRKAFQRAGKYEIAESILVPEANAALAAQGGRLCRILRLLNVTTLTAAHDYLGQLYETFFRFTGGNTIGQYFTPRHIAKFVAELCNVTKRDIVVDPTCGTGGFLISSLYRMIGNRQPTHAEISKLVKGRLFGFESEPITAALCVANMILRGDGTTGIRRGDCFTDPDFPEGSATIALGNPPFPHKKTDTPAEDFVERAMDSLQVRGECAMVVPVSLLTKSGKKQKWRERMLRSHTLRAIVTLPNELFQPYASTTTAIIVLKKGIPHRRDEEVFFSHIENDGYRLKKNVRVEQPGEELTETLAAYSRHESKAGCYGWKTLNGGDWSPGAYIDSALAGDSELKSEIEGLLRNEAAFHALHADMLCEFRRKLNKSELIPHGYRTITRRNGFCLDDESSILGNHFTIYYGQKELHNKEGLEPGNSLIVSSRGEDNGCYGFFGFENLIAPPFATVPSTGSIGMGFVQHWPCGVTDDCLLLLPHEDTPLEALYVAAAVVRLERWRFNYGRKITPERIARFKLPLSPLILSWIKQRRADMLRLSNSILNSFGDNHEIKEAFNHLVDDWLKNRPKGVDVADMVAHPSYQRIIGMGEAAVPLLLNELRRKPDHWFMALYAITGANPVPSESEGNVKKMAKSWLAWGSERGYIA